MKKLLSVSEKTIISAQYFLYFGVLGIYLPYFNLYCYHLGFNGVQIGTLSAARSVAVIVFPLLWSALADQHGLRRQIYISCLFACCAIWSGYLLTESFYPMTIITFIFGIFYAPVISFLEAFTMEVLGPEKKGYGKVRAWGSISFILMVILVGKGIELWDIGMILYLILAGLCLLGATSLKIPREAARVAPVGAKTGIRAFLRFDVLLFLLCAFLMLVSHGAYYGFFSIHLEKLGFGGTFIGFAWAVGVLAEIAVMIFSRRLFMMFSLERVLKFSFAVAVFRWFCLYLFSEPLVILLSQLTHAITYGTFHMASILYIDRLSPEGSKTMGQAVNNALTYGLGLMVGFLLNGYLYERLESFHLFLFSAAISLLAGFLFFFIQRGSAADSGRT